MSNLLTPILNFDIIPTCDLRTLYIVDLSKWLHLSTKETKVDIILPGEKEATTHYYIKSKINIFNSNNLGLSCEDCASGLGVLPDGVYKIKIYVCEGDVFSYEACYLRTVKTQLALDQVFIDLYAACCLPKQQILEKIFEIELLLKSAHANVKDGNIEAGKCHYDKAVELLEELEKCVENTTTNTGCSI